MTREDLFAAFGAVEETRLEKTERNMVSPEKAGEETKRKKTNPTAVRRLTALAAALAILTSLTAAASATGLLDRIIARLSPAEKSGEALSLAYGDKIKTDKPDVRDAFDNPIDMPDMERVEADPTEAEALLGDYLSSVEGSIALEGNTITLKNFVIDDIGIGAITFTIENPAGVPYGDAGYGEVYLGGVDGQALLEPDLYMSGDGTPGSDIVNSRYYLADENAEGTALELVMYFCTGRNPEVGETMTLRLPYLSNGENQEAFIELTPLRFAPSLSLKSENGMTGALSAQGIILDYDSRERGCDGIAIQFSDGTIFKAEGQNVDNTVLGTNRSFYYGPEDQFLGEKSVGLNFNRLIDLSKVSYVTVDYSWEEACLVRGDGTSPRDYDHIEHTETVVYFP